MRGLLCGLLDESFGCGGPTLASELGQSQLSDVIQRTRVQWELFDYNNRRRTVSNANRRMLRGGCNAKLWDPANCPERLPWACR